MELNNEKIAEKISSFLKEEFVKRGKKKAILALSGGIDSAVSAFLCKRAGLDLYVLILPYKNRGSEGLELAKTLGLSEDHIKVIDIRPLVDQAVEEIRKVSEIDKMDIGNIMARQRMIVQYSLSRSLGGLVMGTENLSEYYLGYFTLFGDQACDISPIAGLFKTQVRSLAEYLRVPQWVLDKKPTAGFWEEQTDEEELGFSYQEGDFILYDRFVKGFSWEELKNKFSPSLVEKVFQRVKTTDFKRQNTPKCLIDLNSNMPNKIVSLIGLGKLGSPMVAAYASKGYKVIGVDINSKFVEDLNEGKAPVSETNLQQYISENKERIRATQDYRDAVLNSEITFIIVPTPSMENGNFSTEYALSACKEIGKALKEKNDFHVVALTSTVTPGSTEKDLKTTLEEYSGKKCGQDFGLCYNPEFIALGSVIYDILNPNFVLIGESDPKSGDILEDFYRTVCGDTSIKRMSIVNAEITKISLNTYVTTKISYANMIAELCEKIPGGDVDAVCDALGCDQRIGHKYLKGATGFGGPCFPRDNRALMYTAKEFNYSLPIAEATDRINHNQISRITNLVMGFAQEGKKVGILGLSYKPDTGVIEESHGISIAQFLADRGMEVLAFDPQAMENAKKELGDKVKFCSSLKECLALVDVIVLLTPWKEFKEIEGVKEGAVFIDCWRMVDPKKLGEKVKYVAIGKNS